MLQNGEMEVDFESSAKPLHGQKRPPADDLESEQRLSKRLNLLSLDHANLYTPVTRAPQRRARSNAISDAMPVDESRERIYIHDLDEEIADIESDEERLVFLPDIEKKLAQLPKSVLNPESEPALGKEMVLYSVPESISIPKDQDNVRKAIIESRHRAQVKQAQEAEVARSTKPEALDSFDRLPTADSSPSTNDSTAAIDDIDAMDIG